VTSTEVTFGVDVGEPTTPSAKKEEKMHELEEKQSRVKELIANRPEFSFDDEDDDGLNGITVFSVYGLKNDGKTVICYGIPENGERVLVISFDHMSGAATKLPFITNAGLEFKIKDGLKFMDRSTLETLQETSDISYGYLLFLLAEAKKQFNPDWIIFDGTEVLNTILEQVMRLRNKLMPYQGISNLNVWKERKQYIDDIHAKAVKCANKGVIYTMYTDQHEVVDKEGQVLRKKDIPKWIGSVMRETHIVIKGDAVFEKGSRHYYAIVEGSKKPDMFPDGKYDVTNKRLRDVVCRNL